MKNSPNGSRVYIFNSLYFFIFAFFFFLQLNRSTATGLDAAHKQFFFAHFASFFPPREREFILKWFLIAHIHMCRRKVSLQRLLAARVTEKMSQQECN